MGEYSGGLGRNLRRNDLSLKVSGAESADTTGPWVELGDASVLNLKIDVTAISGTPTMLVYIEGSDDGGVTSYQLAVVGKDGVAIGSKVTAPAAFDAASQVARGAIPAARYVRYRSDLTGTTSFTYSIGGSYV